MSAQESMVHAADPQGSWAYRVGGIAALILAIGYLLTFVVYPIAKVGAVPEGAEARLMYFGENGAAWWVILGLMVFTDLLYVPVGLALYQALKGLHRDAMLLAIACMGLFVVLDLAVTWTTFSSFITLGGTYAAATSDAQRAALVASAGYPSAILDSPLAGIYAILMPSIGILIAGFIMLKGIFSKAAAYLGLAAGITGILAVAGPYFLDALGVMRVINALLGTFWFLLIGWRLYKLGRQ
jgi:hypothetical protein